MNSLSPHLITPSEPPLILAEDKEADLMTYVQMIVDQRWLIFFHRTGHRACWCSLCDAGSTRL